MNAVIPCAFLASSVLAYTIKTFASGPFVIQNLVPFNTYLSPSNNRLVKSFINILKIDYIIKIKIIENIENRNMNNKVNSNKLFNKSSRSNNNNSNSNNSNNNNNLFNLGDIYCEIYRTSMYRFL